MQKFRHSIATLAAACATFAFTGLSALKKERWKSRWKNDPPAWFKEWQEIMSRPWR